MEDLCDYCRDKLGCTVCPITKTLTDMRKIIFMGRSGSGKTTLKQALRGRASTTTRPNTSTTATPSLIPPRRVLQRASTWAGPWRSMPMRRMWWVF